MLTRLEVDGFKNLLKFEVDFGPFNCIAGPCRQLLETLDGSALLSMVPAFKRLANDVDKSVKVLKYQYGNI